VDPTVCFGRGKKNVWNLGKKAVLPRPICYFPIFTMLTVLGGGGAKLIFWQKNKQFLPCLPRWTNSAKGSSHWRTPWIRQWPSRILRIVSFIFRIPASLMKIEPTHFITHSQWYKLVIDSAMPIFLWPGELYKYRNIASLFYELTFTELIQTVELRSYPYHFHLTFINAQYNVYYLGWP